MLLGAANGGTQRERTELGEFVTYDEAVAFCKQELDKLREQVIDFNNMPGLMVDYEDNDAFSNGGGDLTITPEPPQGIARFTAYEYFIR